MNSKKIKKFYATKKDILKCYVEGQKSYKLAIRNYHEWRKKYQNKKISEVPEEIRSAVSKIHLPLRVLQSKSRDMKNIIRNIEKMIHCIIPYYGTCNKNVTRTTNKIVNKLYKNDNK